MVTWHAMAAFSGMNVFFPVEYIVLHNINTASVVFFFITAISGTAIVAHSIIPFIVFVESSMSLSASVEQRIEPCIHPIMSLWKGTFCQLLLVVIMSIVWSPVTLVLGTGSSRAAKDVFTACIHDSNELRDILTFVTNTSSVSRTWADRDGTSGSPLAVAYPTTVDNVADVVKCAYSAGMPMSVVSGRHSYQPNTMIHDGLVIDVSAMCVEDAMSIQDNMMTIPAGCNNGRALGMISSVSSDTILPLVNCPTVGLGGYVLGGGQSDISPFGGLFCDQVDSLEIVLSNGTILPNVSRDNEYSDLFWASCGGGGGLGVITKLTVRLMKAPSNKFTRFTVFYPIETSSKALVSLQEMLKSNVLFGGTGVIGPVFQLDQGLILSLLYLGSKEDGLNQLEDADLLSSDLYLNGSWAYKLPSAVYSNFTEIDPGDAGVPEYASVTIHELSSFAHAMAGSYIQEGVGINMTTACSIFGCNFLQQIDWTNRTNLDSIVAMTGSNDSPLLDKSSGLWSKRQFSYPVPGYQIQGFDENTWQDIVTIATTPESRDVMGFDVLCSTSFFALLAHFTGGQARSNKSAYPWRNDTILFTYMNGMDPQQAKDCNVIKARYDQVVSNALSDQQGANGTHGYYNYLAPSKGTLAPFETFYFGENYGKLQDIKFRYDPDGYFDKPLTITTL